jgi:cell division protein FtsL
MKNKIELKKMCITSCIVVIIFLIIFSILIYKQYKTYTYNFNQKIAGIIDNVLEKYPDIEKIDVIGVFI